MHKLYTRPSIFGTVIEQSYSFHIFLTDARFFILKEDVRTTRLHRYKLFLLKYFPIKLPHMITS